MALLAAFSRPARVLTGAAVCVLAVAGCGSSTTNAPSTTSASSATSAAGSGGTSAGAGGSGEAGKPTTLTGTVEAGVETGCFVLVDENGEVVANLVDVDTLSAPAGSKIEVTGTFEDDLLTTCQQGRPFRITTIQIG